MYAKLHVCVNYAINQRYYAEVLCENRSQKNSCCKGKCAVQKELADMTAKEESQTSKQGLPLLKLHKAEEALPSSFAFRSYYTVISLVNTPLLCSIAAKHASLPFRPPSA